ncbi:hypothetical protein ABH968_004187 [Lysinibacillus sp. RC79]
MRVLRDFTRVLLEFIRMVFLLIIFHLISDNIVAYIYQKLGTKDSITYRNG